MRHFHPYRIALATTLLCCAVTPAFAGVNKDMVQLQTQVQQLIDAVARLQQSNDERMGVLKDLVQQSADSVNRMGVSMDSLQKQLAAQQQTEGGRFDTISGQISALNDSLDEIKARMNRLEKAMNDVQGQQQSISAAMQNLPQTGSTGPGAANPVPPQQQTGSAPPPDQQASVVMPAPVYARPASNAVAASVTPVGVLYKAAYSDYIAARYPIAVSEFNDVIRTYPEDNLSANAYYYLGEIDYRAGKYAAAERSYDKVLEQYPDSSKIPASHLHKGQALLELKQTDAGIREFRALIQRFPSSPEAAQARSKLSGMGVPVRPRD
jgi:tol-pal system protein YbgF